MRIRFNKLLMLITASVAVVGCSDDAIQNEGYSSMEEALAPSEYSIDLDACTSAIASGEQGAAISSKAAINPKDNGAFDTDKVALFMLATHPTNTPFDNTSKFWGREYGLDCTWKQGDKSHSSFMLNTPVKVVFKNDDPAQGSQIVLTTKDRQFYPVGSMHAYNFYAYAPRTDSVVCYADTVKVVWKKGKLDGSQDIIYASAIPDDENNKVSATYKSIAWSANYFRYQANRDQATDEPKAELAPKLAFTHKMMQLMFSIQPGGVDESGNPVDESSKGEKQLNYEDACKTQVVAISLTNVPDTVWMTIAQREGIEHNGELTYSSDARTSTYYLKQWVKKGAGYYADQTFTPVTPKVDSTVVQVPEVVTETVQKLDEEGNPVYDKQGNPEYEEKEVTKYNDVTVVTPIVTKLGGPDETHMQGVILPALTEADRKSPNGSYGLQVLVKYPIDAENPEDIKYYVCKMDLDSDPEKSNKYYRAGYSYDVKLRIYGPNVIKPETSVRTGWQEVDSKDIKDYTGK